MEKGLISIDGLVSVIVASYNSAKFIRDTLESILNQTYNNIEIIIADDNSSDNSIDEAISYFKSVNYSNYKIAASDVNSGIPKNCNNGIKASNGQFIKLIAADDLLLEDCIYENVKFMNEHGNLIQFSNSIYFYESNGEKKEIKKDLYIDESVNNMSVEEQFDKMAYGNYISAPTVFYNRKLFDKCGFFNEKYRFIEDYPLWCQILAKGEKILYLNKYTIFYRQHEMSLTNSNEKYININTFNDYVSFFNDFLKNEILKRKKYLIYWHKKLYIAMVRKIIKNGNKKENKELEIFYKCIDPLLIYFKIKSYLSRV